MIEVS